MKTENSGKTFVKELRKVWAGEQEKSGREKFKPFRKLLMLGKPEKKKKNRISVK